MKRVVIIGSGGVAEALSRGVAECENLTFVQVYGRNRQRVAEVSQLVSCPIYDSLQDADIYIVAVSDRAVEEVTRSLSFPEQSVVVHTAGSVAMDAIDHPKRGVLYPLQSFTPGRRITISEVPFFVEGADEHTTQIIEQVANKLSTNVMRMDSEGRKTLHLCGVFASNFTNAIYATAADIARSAEIPFDLLKPLIKETCDKAVSVENPRTVQTGPAVRGDIKTQQRHMDMLQGNDNLEKIYKILSLQIWETSKKM
ncbi:MAG: Rossmann-like and DUF2520 domain-containing protein [Rikenellaceae bacterium]